MLTQHSQYDGRLQNTLGGINDRAAVSAMQNTRELPMICPHCSTGVRVRVPIEGGRVSCERCGGRAELKLVAASGYATEHYTVSRR
jgi:hypothetical protein